MAQIVAPEKIGWLDHKHILAWLWLLYRSPLKFIKKLAESGKYSQIRFVVLVLIHLYPYLIILIFIGRVLVFNLFDVQMIESMHPTFQEHLVIAVVEVGKLFVLGIAFGIAVGIAVGIVVGIAGGITGGITVGIAFGIAVGIAFGIAEASIVGIGVGKNNFNFSLAAGLMTFLTYLLFYFRLYYQPFHLFCLWPRIKPEWYPFHPVSWDDVCLLPFKGLHRLLCAVHLKNPEFAESEIERLISSYPSQRQEALKARTIILAEKSLKLADLSQLDQLTAQLPQGDRGYLAQTRIIHEKVLEITRQRLLVNGAGRAYMRKAHLETLASQIEALMFQVAGFNEPLASAFGRACKSWWIRTRDEMNQSQTLVQHQPIFQVFRAGDPVDREQEAFVPRLEIIGSIERQLTLATGCPGLLLYARRRMGKSSLLRNLPGFLPDQFRIASISMQDPRSFSGLPQLIQNLQEKVKQVWPAAQLLNPKASSLADFYQQLELWNQQLGQDERLLLTIDEYEMLDIKIGEAVFSTDLLATLRESIQNQRKIIWLFSGSHDTSELKQAPWDSYLVSIRTVELPFFSLDETRLLLTDPLSHSRFWGHRDDRPRMEPTFWGPDGIGQVFHYSGGWPHLTQLLAETLVDLANDYDRRTIDEKFFNKALDEAVSAGSKVLFQLLIGECASQLEQGYLYGFHSSEYQDPPSRPEIARALKHRKLVVEENGLWRLRAPLMRHWLKRKG